MGGYESPDLPSLAFLGAKGHSVTPTIRRGAFQFFEADCSEQEAEALLASPEAALVSAAFDEWRRLRRTLDRLRGNAGGRR